MINFIPVFPLDIVVYPGEPLNLHIFEPRYKQMILECIEGKKPFGLPVIIDTHLGEHGTLMEVVELVKTYENGEMDIRTRGVKVFKILEIVKDLPDKLYTGAIVTYPDNTMDPGQSDISKILMAEVKRLYELMQVSEKFPGDKATVISYEIAHFMGLTRQQEYEVLELFTELHRLEYLRRHMTNNVIPVVKELEAVKARIKMNGHFRDLSSGDLNL